MAVPVEAACPTLHMIFRAVVPGPASSDGSSAIDLRRVIQLHLLHPVIAVCHPVACRLVARSHHHERGMMTVCVDDTLRLLKQILVDGLPPAQLHTVVGPRRAFGLEIYPQLVGSHKRRLRRTVRVEAYMVESVFLHLSQYPQPRLHVHRSIARLRETAVLYRAPEPDGLSVQINLSALYRYVAYAEGDGNRLSLMLDGTGIEIRISLAPPPDVLSQ